MLDHDEYVRLLIRSQTHCIITIYIYYYHTQIHCIFRKNDLASSYEID